MKKITLLFGLLLSTLTFAQTFTVADIEYTVDGSNVSITDYTGGGGAITIPATVDDPNTVAVEAYPVVSIADGSTVSGVFNGVFASSGITGVTFTEPSNMTRIGLNAFYSNSISGTVALPSSLVDIANNAFRINAITTINPLPSGLETIGVSCFLSNSITAVTLPSGFQSLGTNGFKSNNITSLTINSDIPANGLGEAAFENNANLASVTLPVNIVDIPNRLFANTGLTSITFDGPIETIGASAFLNCNFSTFTVPATVTSIGNSAFSNGDGTAYLTGIEMLGTAAPTLGTDAFGSDATTAASLTLPSGYDSSYEVSPWSDFTSLGAEALISSEEAIVSLSSDAIVVTSAVSLVTVYDIAGSVVLSSTDATVSISGIASGVYILKLDTDKGVVVKKFVK